MLDRRSRRSIASVACALVCASPLVAGDSLTVFGTSTVGTSGIAPRLWANQTPAPGASGFAFEIDRGLGGAPAVVFLAAARGSVTLAGLDLNLDLATLLPVGAVVLTGSGAGAGSGSVPAPLPNLPNLVGVTLPTQALVFDSGSSSALGLSGTRGLELKLALPGLLIVPRSVGGTADPQHAMDLASGQLVEFSGGRVNNGEAAVFTNDGSEFVIPAALSGSVVSYDARTFPPTYSKSASIPSQNGHPWSAAMHPDGLRLYVVNQGTATTACTVDCLWAQPRAANYLMPFPGGNVTLPNISDALDIRFSFDGNQGFLSVLGLVSGGARLLRIDTNRSSTTYHQSTGQLAWPGKFVFAMAISPNRLRAYVTIASLGGNSEIAVVDLVRFVVLDQDPGTPGIQNLGGEMSFARTALEKQITQMTCGPRGDFLYTANYSTVSKIDIDPASPTYRKVTTTNAGMTAAAFSYSVVLTDAGDRMFVGTHTDSNVLEFDPKTMALVKSTKVGNNITQLGIR